MDSAPLGKTASAIGAGAPAAALAIRPLLALFVVFVFVMSNVFRDFVLRRVSKDSVGMGGSVSSGGEVIRGIFLVAIYAGYIYLHDNVLC